MNDTTAKTVASVLRGVESVGGIVGAAGATTPEGIASTIVGAAAGLAADIVDASADPMVTIQAMRSIVAGWDAAKGNIQDYIDQLAASGKPTP